MSATGVLELQREESPLELARERRGLSRAEAAARAALSSDEIAWLEEGRLYRFRTPHLAAAAACIYATSLGLDHREALELAGRPLPPRTPETTRRRLAVSIGTGVALVAAVAVAILVPQLVGRETGTDRQAAGLPPPWRVHVDVLNGSGDINYTRRVADQINAMAYRVDKVAKATRFDYPTTAVYYPPGAAPLAERLADELCVPIKPLPGGDNPRRLVVIVGPASVGGC